MFFVSKCRVNNMSENQNAAKELGYKYELWIYN